MTAVTPGRHGVVFFRKRVTTNSCQYCVVVLFPDCISGTTQWTRSIFVSSYRLISTGQLSTLLRLHCRPINLVVYQGSYSLEGDGRTHLEVGFPLRCLQRLSRPDVANLQCPWQDNRYTRGPFIPVLSY